MIGLTGEYGIISNRETGLDRCDIILKSRSQFPSCVIECKYTKNDKLDLNKIVNEVIEQIIYKRYDEGLKGKIIYIAIDIEVKK